MFHVKHFYCLTNKKYKKKLTIWRVLAAKFVVMLVCDVILTTLCLNVLYGQAL